MFTATLERDLQILVAARVQHVYKNKVNNKYFYASTTKKKLLLMKNVLSCSQKNIVLSSAY